jgi:capsular exopolysaccharide synthesis family protein
MLTRPIFRSTARIVVEDKPLGGRGMNGAASDVLANLYMPGEDQDVATQMEVITGYVILTTAAEKAGLPQDAAVSGQVAVAVKRIKDTDVLEISAESWVKDWAYKMAHQIPETYLDYVTDNRRQEVVKALGYAQSLLTTERTNLDNASRELERYQILWHVPSVDTEVQARVADAVDAETDVHRNQAQVASDLARLRDMLLARSHLSPTLETPTQTTNTTIDGVKDQLEALKTERARLLVSYTPEHDTVQKIDAQIQALQERLARMPKMQETITRQPNPELASLDDRVLDARSALAADEASLTKAQERAVTATNSLTKFSPIERKQAQLMAQIDEHRARVAELIASVDMLQIRSKATHDPVLLVWPALGSTKVAPRISNNMVVACILGLLLGIGLIMLQEYVDDRISSPEAARSLLGAPALGYVPLVNDGSSLILDIGSAGFVLESYRVLRSNVQFATVDVPVLSLLVTSTVPSEGKSVTAANLAIALALDGKRVILVDTDLRRPTLHNKFNLQKLPGLTDVLRGTTGFEDALQETTIPGLRFLPAGPFPPNPAELLNSQAMRQLHVALKEDADIVIYDSPPCLATADAQVMSAMVDGVLYVMQFGVAKKSAVMHAFELLRQAHANVLGIVFNKIDLSSKRSNYYGYYGYYGYYEYYSRYTMDTPDADNVPTEPAITATQNGSDRPQNSRGARGKNGNRRA